MHDGADRTVRGRAAAFGGALLWYGPREMTSASDAAAGKTRLQDRPFAAIFLLLGSMLVFSFMDALSKELTADLHPAEIAWARFLVIVLVLLPVALRQGPRVLVSAAPRRQVLRGFCMLGSSIFFIGGLARMPLADATAVGFASPLLVTILSIPLLGEKVGIRRWSAVAMGLVGVLIVVQPGTSAFDPAAIYPLLSAACWALGLIITRQMQALDSVLTTLFWSNAVGLAATSVAVPFVWVTPNAYECVLLAVAALFSTAGQSLLIVAFRFAPASLLAPFSYSQMLWSVLLGWIVFHQLPDAATWVGAAIIVASGLYTLHRERVVRRGPLRQE